MLTDPQTITINAVPYTLNKVSSSGQSSVYLTADGSNQLTVSHQKARDKRLRRMVRIDQKAIVVDPLSSANDFDRLSIYLVIDEPEFGFADSDITNLITGFKTWLDSTMVGKILSGQS